MKNEKSITVFRHMHPDTQVRGTPQQDRQLYITLRGLCFSTLEVIRKNPLFILVTSSRQLFYKTEVRGPVELDRQFHISFNGLFLNKILNEIIS